MELQVVFLICLLVGGVLLALTVLVHDIFGALLDSLHAGIEINNVSITPLLLGFISMFGVGGLIGAQVFSAGAGGQIVAALIGGFVGAGLVFALFTGLRRAEGAAPTGLSGVVGRSGDVAVAIPAGGRGSIIVLVDGINQEYSATASVAIPLHARVTVSAVNGIILVVTPLTLDTTLKGA